MEEKKQKKRGMGCLTFVLIGFALVVLIGVASSGGGNDAGSANDGSNSGANTEVSDIENENSLPSNSGADEKTSEDTAPVIFDPIVYTGSGDDVIELEAPEDVWVMHITGNANSDHFAVKGYDDSDNYTDLFVNTTDPYDGIVIDAGQTTTLLEINATGEWTIEVVSAFSLPVCTKGDAMSGAGDSVFLTTGLGRTADITGNAGSSHFAVKALDSDGYQLLVNTTDPYEGTVKISNPLVFVVTAEDDWTITFN